MSRKYTAAVYHLIIEADGKTDFLCMKLCTVQHFINSHICQSYRFKHSSLIHVKVQLLC